MNKKLTRSNNRKFLGVCGGIAEYFDVDPTVIRAAFAVLTLCTGLILGIITYLALSCIMPQKL